MASLAGRPKSAADGARTRLDLVAHRGRQRCLDDLAWVIRLPGRSVGVGHLRYGHLADARHSVALPAAQPELLMLPGAPSRLELLPDLPGRFCEGGRRIDTALLR